MTPALFGKIAAVYTAKSLKPESEKLMKREFDEKFAQKKS